MKRIGLFSLSIWMLSASAHGQVDLSGDIGFLTDYRDRGISLSGNDVAGQLALELGGEHAYGGLLLSTAEDLAGRDLLARAYVGYAAMVADAYEVTAQISVDTLHGTQLGENSPASGEGRVTIARDLGLLYARAGLALAPDGRWSDPYGTVLYPFMELMVPIPRMPALTVTAQAGYTAAFEGTGRFVWQVGLVAGWRDFEAFAGYTDTSTDAFGSIGGATGLFRLRYYF